MKRQLIGYLGLMAYWLSLSLAQAQDNPVVMDDLVFVVEQSFNRNQLLTAMDQFHTNTGVGLAITTVYQDDVYTTFAQQTQDRWLQRALGLSLFITLNKDKTYQQCVMQVTPAVELLLPTEERQRIQRDFMEYYFLGDFTTDDAFTQGMLAGIAEMGKQVLRRLNPSSDDHTLRIENALLETRIDNKHHIDSLREEVKNWSDELEDVIKRGGFYRIIITGPNDEFIGEGMSRYAALIERDEMVKKEMSEIMLEHDNTRNQLYISDVTLQKYSVENELISDLLTEEQFPDFIRLVEKSIDDTGELKDIVKDVIQTKVKEKENE